MTSQDAVHLVGDVSVSRETFAKLRRYHDEIERWQSAQNLVSRATIDDLWERHILDSAQILALECARSARTWLDFGSGAGLPGLVVAILRSNDPDFHLTLVESNAKKCAFLRHCVGTLKLRTEVIQSRLEDQVANHVMSVDVVSARAVSSLPKLLELSYPWLSTGAIGLFPKGQTATEELNLAAKGWQFDVACRKSFTDRTGVILEIRNLKEGV